MIAHWLNVELWAPMWPNIFAPSVWTLLGIGASHIHMVYLTGKRHDELMGRGK